jgi:hypothetical protein
MDLSNSKENNKEKGNLFYANINNSNMKSIDGNRFSVTNSPPFKEIDEGLEEYNNCLKNALIEAINENEKVNINNIIFYTKFCLYFLYYTMLYLLKFLFRIFFLIENILIY